MKYYLIAGEASGDLHGGILMEGLFAEDSHADVRFWGGPAMEAVGGTKVRDYGGTAVMGFTDVVRSLGKISRNLRDCKADILSWNPDVVILIDYPGFNMKIARFCHESGIRVFYYIAPKTWASREGRNRRLKAWVERLFIIFPFEIPYFDGTGIPFTYKGNPLVDAVDGHEYARPCPSPYVAILPGSRRSEVSRTLPAAMQMADSLHSMPRYGELQFLIAAAPSLAQEDYLGFIGDRPYVKLLSGRTYDILKYAEAALVNSGTASLEAALTGTPQVVCWSGDAFSVFVARHLLRVQDRIAFISLGNLILDRPAFRELIQEDFTAEAATAGIREILEDGQVRARMKEDCSLIRELLGGTGAGRAVAAEIVAGLKAGKGPGTTCR